MEPGDVLLARARALAIVPRTPEATPRAHVLVASIGPQRYGFAVEQILRVRPLGRCTPLPYAPHGVVGVAKLEGNVLAVFGGRTWRGLPEEVSTETPVLLLGARGAPLALLVDTAHDTIDIPEVAPGAARSGDAWLRAIVDDVLIVDVPRLIELLSEPRGTR